MDWITLVTNEGKIAQPANPAYDSIGPDEIRVMNIGSREWSGDR